MAKTEMIRARVEPGLKHDAEAVFKALGLTPTAAITLFYKQVTLTQGILDVGSSKLKLENLLIAAIGDGEVLDDDASDAADRNDGAGCGDSADLTAGGIDPAQGCIASIDADIFIADACPIFIIPTAFTLLLTD
ncbi:MAG: type II toxin-antitoxin system RelB/DinJ family antitoxin [Bacteroidetes bacterium]|nr:type II toxin-antitoxin system RelB/DinJ family antitoxin [Bacteroidota bacterium]